MDISETVMKAQVSFLHCQQQLLECGWNGLEYTNEEHDITLRIPKGAVAKGMRVHIQFGVTMYGPFSFPENIQPISPILWLCLQEEDAKLKKPYQVVLPHYLSDKAREYCTGFAKANHNKSDQSSYDFLTLDVYVKLISKESQGYGLAEIDHFCYMCLIAEKKPKITTDINYCLATVECISQLSRQNVIFCVSYFLRTCVQVRVELMT